MSPSQKAVWKKSVMWLRCGKAPLPGVWRHCFKMHDCRSAVYKELRHFEACSYYRLDNFKMFLGRVLCWGKEKKNQRSNFYNSVFWFQPATAVNTGRSSLAIHSVVCLCLLCLVFNMYPHKHTVCLCWAEWGPPALFLFHRAYFTSPLPLRVPRQQPLLVYLCVFALWFSSEQHSPSPSGDWLSGFFIQSSMKQRLAFVWACSVCIFLETLHFSLHV